MAQAVLITLTVAGADTGPFNLYSDVDGYNIPFESNVSKAALESGYVSILVPDFTTIIRVKSVSVLCDNHVDLPLGGLTTTTTSSTTTTTTTTIAPTTTTTTTAAGGTIAIINNSINPSSSINYSTPAWYTVTLGTQPVTLGDTTTGTHTGQTGGFSMNVTKGTLTGCLSLVINSVTVETLGITNDLTLDYSFTTDILATDVVQIILTDGACP